MPWIALSFHFVILKSYNSFPKNNFKIETLTFTFFISEIVTIKFTGMKTTILVGSMAAVLVGLLIGVSYTETASAGIPPGTVFCDGGQGISEHFNKILFSSTAKLTGDGPIVKPDRPYEVIVLVSSFTVIDPIQEVLNVLQANGYAKNNESPPKAGALTIIDVELSTICRSLEVD